MAVPAIIGGIAGTIAAGYAVYEAVNKIAQELARSVVIEVKNATDETWRIEGAHHSSGGFGTPPPSVIHPRQSIVFSSRSTIAVGAVGNLRLVSDRVWLGMSWHNPVVGNNDFRSSENGERGGEFDTIPTVRSGNHAKFEYTLTYSDPMRVLSVAQALTASSFGALAGGFPAGARQAGHEANGVPLFVGRARHANSLHPGKTRADWRSVAISYGGAELWPSDAAEVWLGRVPNGGEGVWLPPDRAQNGFMVGYEADTTPLYAARVAHAGGVHIGKWRRDWTAASLSYGGKEIWLGGFEVLCTR